MENRNSHQISENIHLGDFWAAFDKESLQKNGITGILTCGKGMKPFHPQDFDYKIINIDDEDSENILKYFEECITFIDSQKKVLIHCQMGISRSSTVTISYLMKKNKWNYEKAFEFVKKKRGCIRPNDGFVKQLKEWEKLITIEE